VPDRPIQTIGPRLLLVVHKSTPNEAVQRLISAVFETSFAELTHPPLEAAHLRRPPETEPHPAVEQYLAKREPLLTGERLELVEKWTTIGGALAGSVMFLWGWVRQRRTVGLTPFLQRISDVEQRAIASPDNPAETRPSPSELYRQLAEIKDEALQSYARGRLGDERALSAVLAHIAEVRASLDRV
jgi:hypothetical protein